MAFPGSSATKDWLTRYARPFLGIECGDWSYGKPTVHAAPSDASRRLSIGRYCSIGPGVDMYIGRAGRHATNTLSTYPIGMAVTDAIRSTDSAKDFPARNKPNQMRGQNLDLVIGHDVWIGARAMIFAGVTIGTGAVIGACAVVTNDVPPYAVMAGVPARVLRYRHDPATVSNLLASKWWELEPDEIWTRIGSLVNSPQVEQILPFLRQEEPE